MGIHLCKIPSARRPELGPQWARCSLASDRLEQESLSRPGPCKPRRARFLWALLTPPFLTWGYCSSCFLQNRTYPVIMYAFAHRDFPLTFPTVFLLGVPPRPLSFSLEVLKVLCSFLLLVKGINCLVGERYSLKREPGSLLFRQH